MLGPGLRVRIAAPAACSAAMMTALGVFIPKRTVYWQAPAG